MVTQKQRVHNAIMAAVCTGPFYEVKYSDKGDMALGKETKAKSAYANEKNGAWGDSLHRRTMNRDREDWEWSLVLEFLCEVDASLFEQAITQTVLRLPPLPPSQGQIALRSVRIELQSTEYQHPPRSGPTKGTKINYTLVARETHR